MPTPILDLAGWRFGRLMVLNPAPAIGLRMRWVCACDCGQTTEVASGDLRKGAKDEIAWANENGLLL